MTTISTKNINITTYFEYLTIRLHVLYVLNTYVKFHVNQMIFIIQSIDLFSMHNFKI